MKSRIETIAITVVCVLITGFLSWSVATYGTVFSYFVDDHEYECVTQSQE